MNLWIWIDRFGFGVWKVSRSGSYLCLQTWERHRLCVSELTRACIKDSVTLFNLGSMLTFILWNILRRAFIPGTTLDIDLQSDSCPVQPLCVCFPFHFKGLPGFKDNAWNNVGGWYLMGFTYQLKLDEGEVLGGEIRWASCGGEAVFGYSGLKAFI